MAGVHTPWLDFVFNIKKLPERDLTVSQSIGEQSRRRKFASTIPSMVHDDIVAQSAGLREKHAWLNEFEATTNWRFTGADDEFIRNPTEMIHTLLIYTDKWLGIRIQRELAHKLSRHIQDHRLVPDLDDPASKYLEYLNKVDHAHHEEAIQDVFDKFLVEKVLDNGHHLGIWRAEESNLFDHLPKRIVRFNYRHCAQSQAQDPLVCLSNLEDKAVTLRMDGKGREAALQAEIDRLREERDKYIIEKAEAIKEKEKYMDENKTFRTAITHLAYRHLMEALPAPNPALGHAATWNNFWKQAMTQAGRGKPGPVKNLLDALPKSIWPSQIQKDGQNLYSTYSVNIHGFEGNKGVFEVPTTISNHAENLILKALKPEETNVKPDGSIEWAKERARFI